MANLTEVQKEFIQAMVNYGALKFGEFELKSGRMSPYFFNIGDLSMGRCLHTLAEGYGEAIYQQFGGDFDVLFGPAYKGIPLAAVTAQYLSDAYKVEVRYCSNRKEAKDHGEKSAIVGGPIQKDDRIVIIEDVMTSGKSIEEVIPIIEAQSGGAATILGEVIALNRCERSGEAEESALDVISKKYGFPVTAIITIDDVIDCLYTNGDKTILTEEVYRRMQEYLAQYRGKTVV